MKTKPIKCYVMTTNMDNAQFAVDVCCVSDWPADAPDWDPECTGNKLHLYEVTITARRVKPAKKAKRPRKVRR